MLGTDDRVFGPLPPRRTKKNVNIHMSGTTTWYVKTLSCAYVRACREFTEVMMANLYGTCCYLALLCSRFAPQSQDDTDWFADVRS